MINVKKNLKSYLSFLKYFTNLSLNAPRLGLIIFLLSISGILNLLGFTFLIPIFDSILFLKNEISNNFIIENIQELLNLDLKFSYIIIITVACIFLSFLFQAFGNYYSYKLRFNFIKNKRKELLNLFSNLNWQSVLERHSGKFNDLIINQTEHSGSAYFTIYSFWISIMQMVTFAIICMLISLKLFLISILIFSLGAAISLGFQFYARKFSKIYSRGFQNFGYIISDINNNTKSFKVSANRKNTLRDAYKFIQIVAKNVTKTYKLHSIQTFLIQIFTLGVLFIIVFTYKLLEINGSEVLVFLASLRNFSGHLQNVFNNLLHFQAHSAPIELLENEITDMRIKQEEDSSKTIDEIENIKFEKVKFNYPNKSYILNEVSFELNKGSTISISGESGSGKSTILDLLLLLHKPNSGKIFINSIDSKKIDKKSFRSRIGYVPQGVTLNYGTILSNITLNKNFDKDLVVSICKKLKIYEWITKQKKGFKTIVGEKGNTLSGGQSQRIFLARIILQNPDLLILDEATGALDKQNENEIHEFLKSEKHKRMTVIVSHKVDTVSYADKFLLIKNNIIYEK